jgi:hypothetical protein
MDDSHHIFSNDLYYKIEYLHLMIGYLHSLDVIPLYTINNLSPVYRIAVNTKWYEYEIKDYEAVVLSHKTNEL